MDHKKAEIVKVSDNHAIVKDETGEHHAFMHGSINGIKNPVVGEKGTIVFQGGPSFSLPFFKKD